MSNYSEKYSEYIQNIEIVDISEYTINDHHTNQPQTILERQIQNTSHKSSVVPIRPTIKQKFRIQPRVVSISKPDIQGKELKFPLTTIEQINEFEHQLFPNKPFRNVIINNFSNNERVKKNTIMFDIAFAVAHEFFSKELLEKFSWSGSLNIIYKKLPFKDYNNIIDTVHEIVHKIDGKYSKGINTFFFKYKLLACSTPKIGEKDVVIRMN